MKNLNLNKAAKVTKKTTKKVAAGVLNGIAFTLALPCGLMITAAEALEGKKENKTKKSDFVMYDLKSEA